jgi:peptidoglycan/xylan/chitin deacetylase (PgdA/CDA1 family)
MPPDRPAETGGRMLRRAAAWGIVVAVLSAGLAAPAAASQLKPFRVRAASLSQGGRLLYWRVTLDESFSVTTFKRERRSLCLLLEGPAHGLLSGRACLVPDLHPGHGPRLVFQKLSHGRAAPGRYIGTLTKPTGRGFTATFTPADVGHTYRALRWQVLTTVAPPACEPTPASACRTLYPRSPRLVKLHTPRLVGCAASGNSLVYSGPSDRREIALTFDDGPWNDPPTADFLNVLERYHAVATFFEIGDQISTYDPGGTLERRMLADGDMIGDHTWTHPDMTTLSASEQRSQLLMTASAISQATDGFRPCLWRPPYGSQNSQVVSLARSLGLITIQWDVDTVDWSQPGTATIYQRAVDGAHNGAIILQHFGGGPRQETLDALPQEITTLRSRGYKLVTIPELLGLHLIYK